MEHQDIIKHFAPRKVGHGLLDNIDRYYEDDEYNVVVHKFKDGTLDEQAKEYLIKKISEEYKYDYLLKIKIWKGNASFITHNDQEELYQFGQYIMLVHIDPVTS